MKKISLLFLTSHLPFPPISGGRLREFEVIKRLKQFCDTYLCVLTKTWLEDIQNIAYLEPFCQEIRIFCANEAVLDEKSEIPAQVFRNTSTDARKYIADLLDRKKVELVHIEGFYMKSLLPVKAYVPILLVEQNIEYLLFLQRYKYEADGLKKWNLNQYKVTKKEEIEAWKACNKCVFLTKQDKEIAQAETDRDDLSIICNGIDHVHKQTDCAYCMEEESENYILYVGNFDYFPNIDAATYLLDIIFPKVLKEVPDVKMYIVGNESDVKLEQYKKNKNVRIFGRQEKLDKYIKNSLFCVFPLRMGGGIKVKVLEALYFNKVVVTTSIGAQGIYHDNETAIIVEDNGKIMAEKIIKLLQSREELSVLEKKCKDILCRFYTWDESVKRLVSEYRKLVEGKNIYEG